jgi:nucleotide-binding universal stress UspA family protein
MAVLRKVLVAVDGSEASVKATDFALTIAKNNEAEAIFLHVLESAKAAKELEEEVAPTQRLPEPADKIYLDSNLRKIMKKYETLIQRGGVKHTAKVLVGKPADKIVETAKKLNVDMIVLGFVGLKGVRKVGVLGSVSRAVSEKSTVPVTIVPL